MGEFIILPTIMTKVPIFLVLSMLHFAFAQEGAIRIKIPLDSTGMLIASPKSEAQPQKLGLSSNRSLNLAELSAKDTASFETYSKRLALVQDSISATQKNIENSKKRTASQMPPLEPKDEYEKQFEFDERKAKRERELGERMLRDYKPLADRLSELEKAKKKIEDNRSSLYCTIEIKTNPAASIYLNNEEIGESPAEYNRVLPGNAAIRVQKENYEPWDTTLTLQPAQKLKLSVTLQEKSIFSKEGEIDFPKTLAKDTTVKGYRERIGRVKARIAQIDTEIVKILENFSNTYPALEPQKPNETAQDFERRKTAWNDEGIRQMGVLRYKHEAYKNKLIRSLNALEDNIIATESQLITEAHSNAHITLGAYDVEREFFEIEVQDTANAKSPFYFAGLVGVPRDTAKAMNRSTDGFLTGVSYLNYPFVSKDSSSFNIAMKELALSRKAIPLKVEGSFKPLGKFELMEGYGSWRAHADSLLRGELKGQGLDLNYVINGENAKVAAGEASSDGGGGLGWRGWTRFLTFTAAIAFGTAAIINDDSTVIFGAGAGVFATAGILTFVF